MLKVVLVVDSRIHFPFDKFLKKDRKCFLELEKEFTYVNSKYYKLRKMGKPTFGVPKILKSFQKIKDEIFFNRGCLRKIKTILKSFGHVPKIRDHRLELPPIIFNSKIKLRSEQKTPVDLMLKKQQGLIRGLCSSGKTVMLLEAIARAKQPAVVIVWNTTHQKHWIKEATDPKLLNLPKRDIGGIGGVFKKPKFGKLNICMQQSLYKEKNLNLFVDKVGFVGGDEIQRFASRTYNSVINEFSAKYRLGVSANERRKDGMQSLIYDSFGKVIHEVQDVAVGSRMAAKIYLVPTQFRCDRYEWNSDYIQLLDSLTTDQDRNEIIFRLVRRSVRKKKMVLVLVERKYQAMLFRFVFEKYGYKTGLVMGHTNVKYAEDNQWPDHWVDFVSGFDADKEFDRVKRLGEKKKLDVVIGTVKADVGLNIKPFDHAVVTTPTGNNLERFSQQKGRIERSLNGKKTPVLFYLWDVKMEKTKEAGNSISRNFPGVSILRLKKK